MNRRWAPVAVLWLFPLVAVALLVGVVLAVVALGAQIFGGYATRALLQWTAVPLAVAIGIGAWRALRIKPEPAEGIELTPAEHPALWAEVNRLAAVAQTDPPERIVVVAEVNASVAEVAGRRELELGLPLVATFTIGQLRAILAHELGQHAGGDTAAGARELRRVAFLAYVRANADVLWRWFFTAYLHLYALAAGPSSRAAELRADALSAAVAGPRVAAESLRALRRADVAWEHTFDAYVPLFELSGRRASLGEAMRRIIEANRGDVDEAVDALIAEESSAAADTHPPLRERIARFQARIATDPFQPEDPAADRPATELFTGGTAWLDVAEGELLAQDRPLVGWDALIAAGMRGAVDVEAEELGASIRRLGLGDGGLDSVLRLIDDSSEGGVVARVGGDDPDARETTIELVASPLLSALMDAGAARVEPSWSRPAEFVAPDGAPLGLEERLSDAIDRTDSAELRSWLAERGVDVGSARVASGASPERWLAAMSHMKGPWDGRRDVHLWSSGILALPPLDKATVKANKDQISEKHQHPRLYQAVGAGPVAGRSLPEALWWDASRITGGDVNGRLKLAVRFDLDDAEPLHLTGTLETATIDSPDDVAAAMLYLMAPKG
ncbi:M48 family metallopeptidase [Propioniciclava soli]|uniref:M48 family metallopeptidase n=1 Tax=Propioniciclava soli TaxID=2775081 RepID=A0ABZ3CCU7_9ACTN